MAAHYSSFIVWKELAMLDRMLGEPRGAKMVELGLMMALVSLATLIAVISVALV